MCSGARALRPLRVWAAAVCRTASPLAPAPGGYKTLLALRILLILGMPRALMPDCLGRRHPPEGGAVLGGASPILRLPQLAARLTRTGTDLYEGVPLAGS